MSLFGDLSIKELIERRDLTLHTLFNILSNILFFISLILILSLLSSEKWIYIISAPLGFGVGKLIYKYFIK